jgi:tetratricopeptide (TPR) repeat protein
MPSLEAFTAILLLLLLVAGALGLWATLRPGRRDPASAAQRALGKGEFAAALAAARLGGRPERDELYAAAVASRHLLRLKDARRLLGLILAADPADGEAWLEAGLAAAYEGDFDAAESAFARVEPLRSDLLESLTLHRAWLALKRGDRRAARRRFEEVETSLESKLRSDLGGGEPLFAEWFLQAAALWEAFGDAERAAWARREGEASAPESRLGEVIADAGAVPPLQ